jgi:hypothetical protein
MFIAFALYGPGGVRLLKIISRWVAPNETPQGETYECLVISVFCAT